MPKVFEYKQAKEQVNFYNKLLRDLKAHHGLLSKYKDNVNKKVSHLIRTNSFKKIVENGIKGETIDLNSEDIQELIKSIYFCIKAIEHSKLCETLLDFNEVDVQTNIEALSCGTNGVLWFLSSKQKKKDAEDAYEKLIKLRNDSFVLTSLAALTAIANLDNVDFLEIRNDFVLKRSKYKETLNNINHFLFTDGGYVPLFNNYFREYEYIKNKIEKINGWANSTKTKIDEAIKKFLLKELMNGLSTISVDELAKDKSGIKTKYLRDAGFDTLGDIYTASHLQIASIYGISEDKAYTIKSKTDKYAISFYSGIKIKLSSDEKNDLTTNIVKSIYEYIEIKEYIDSIKRLDLEYGENIIQAFEFFKNIGNGLGWIFLSDTEINNTILMYNFVKDNLIPNYKVPVDEIHDKYLNKKVDYSLAWDVFAADPIKFYNVIEEVCPGILGNDDSFYGLPKDLAREVQDQCFFPDGLRCTLRRYQEWGVKYILHQGKALLGDEMGLGKTIQAIATMVSLKNTGATHFLVVCPASVVTNWCKEIVKHSKLRPTKIHGTSKAQAFKSWIKTGGVAVTNFESTSSLKLEPTFKYSLLVVDEAHYIKNTNSQRSINTRKLSIQAERVLFMTGTALENKVEEMITLIEALNPSIANRVKGIAYMATAPEFRNKIAPVYYRRKREDVLTELPEKTEINEWLSLNSEEEKVYEQCLLSKNYQQSRRLSWNIEDLNKSIKANRLKEIVEEAKEDGRKVLVFSYFLDTISNIYEFLRGKCLNPIIGKLNINRRQEIIDEFNNAPSGTVLLSQITSGGTGLNIQSASVVVICEPQFKPSTENQAISRAYRMGQSRNVIVYRLLCENTIEEKMMNVLANKQKQFDAFADESVAAKESGEIDNATFGKIIEQEIDRIIKKNNKNSNNEIVEEEILNEEETIEESKNLTNNEEYYKSLMNMTYSQLVEYLLNKYGKVPFDYFANENCRTKNKNNSRTKEGLIIHHIDEDKAINLSDPQHAINSPFSYQKADRLVYCNYLEHFLLHILIAEEATKNGDVKGIGGAVAFICRDINDVYSGYPFTSEYKINCSRVIENDFESYIKMLNRLWSLIKSNKIYSSVFISKEILARTYDGNICKKVLERIN